MSKVLWIVGGGAALYFFWCMSKSFSAGGTLGLCGPLASLGASTAAPICSPGQQLIAGSYCQSVSAPPPVPVSIPVASPVIVPRVPTLRRVAL